MHTINPQEARARLDRLTPRELQVVKLRCEGLELQAIGERLHVTKSTVSVELRAALAKLDLGGLTEVEQIRGLVLYYWPILENMQLPPAGSEQGRSGGGSGEDRASGGLGKGVPDGGRAEVPPPKPPRDGNRGGRVGCWIALVLVLGLGLGAGGVYLWLRNQNVPMPFLPSSPVPQPAFTSMPPAATRLAPTQALLVVATATQPPAATFAPTETPTNQPSPAPKAYYEDGEWAPMRTGVYAGIHNTFMQEGFAMCTHPVPGFGVFIDIRNDTGDRFLLRYDASAFHAQDDLGNSYSLRGAGIGYCDDGPGPQEYQVSSYRTEYISLIFSGQVPLEAKYLVITADSLSGTKVIFHKLY